MFNKPIYIVDGFDIVGKSTLMKELLPDYKLWYPTHDLSDKILGRHESWVLGYAVLDYLSQVTPSDKIVINRGVFSSYVYMRLYTNKIFPEDIINWYKSNQFFLENIGHIYVKHEDVDSAKLLYESSKSREKSSNPVSDKYDSFRTFSDYWVLYNKADLLFREIYQKLGVTPRVFTSDPTSRWVEC